MAELERARSSLSSTFGVADQAGPVPVVLYARAFEAPSTITEHGSLTGAVRCTVYGPEILLAAEEAGTIKPSSVPRHEVVHAMMCRALGQTVMDLVPRWFHEGVATFYEHDGWRDWPKRSARRIRVWLSRNSLFEPTEFCTRSGELPPSEVSLFYATAGEFIEELVQRNGPNLIPDVAFRTAETMNFERALVEVTGTSCERIYAEWTAGFQG
ncbi:MAG: hypothetical protein IH956_02615 [Chloroflexi bacterium]|nr:hypothetical protein [Chloroflexota bacterium]